MYTFDAENTILTQIFDTFDTSATPQRHFLRPLIIVIYQWLYVILVSLRHFKIFFAEARLKNKLSYSRRRCRKDYA